MRRKENPGKNTECAESREAGKELIKQLNMKGPEIFSAPFVF
jgi:hypothetical protein